MALPLTYYVQFRDSAGNLVTGTDGRDWFAITGVTADQMDTFNPTSASTSNSVIFNPLSFMLGTDTLDPALLAAQAAGTVFSQIEVAGYSGVGSSAVLVTDDLFKNAAISETTTSNTGMGVAVDYADTIHRFYPTQADGSAGTPVTAGYNRLSGTADTSTNNVDGTPGHAANAPLSGVPDTTDTTSPLTFFVQFRDTNGNALASVSGQTWFAVTGLVVSAERLTNLTVNSSGNGRIVFDPLTFTVEGAALPMLLQRQAAGTAFGAVELAGYSGSGLTAVLVEDIVDKNATVASLTTRADGSHTVALSTTDLVQSVIPANGGIPGAAVTHGWSLRTNTADDVADTRASAIGTPDAPTVAPLIYFVQFRNAAGTVLTGDGGQTWFAATEVGFGSEAATGGSFAFNPLSFRLASDSILGKLFANQGTSAPLRQIEVAGYDAGGALVSDDVFKNAVALSDQRRGDGTATLTYNYLAQTETTYGLDALGQTVSATQGYNAYSGAADTSTDTASGSPGYAPAATSTPPPTTPGASGLTYFVQFRTSAGTVLQGRNGATWFAVGDVGFTTTLTAAANPSTPGGRIAFGGLSFTIGADTVLPVLFQAEAAATAFQSVELAGYSGTGASALLVQDDLLKLATISSDTAQADGSAALTIQYGGLLETTFATDANGTTTATGSYGWDATRNQQDNTTTPVGGGTTYPLAASVHGTPSVAAGPGALTFYVQFRDYDGNLLTDVAGSTWFTVSNVSLPSGQPVNTTSGAGTPRLTFGPASFTLTAPSLVPLLFAAETTGTPYESVEIAGYDGTGPAATLVQNTILKLAAVASLTNGGDSSLAVSLQYGGAVLRSYSTDGAGTVTQARIGGWNTVRNVSDTGSGTIQYSSGGSTNSSGPLTPAAPLIGTPTALATPVPLTYFVQFVPRGTSASAATAIPFIAIGSFSINSLQALNIGSQSTGAGAGKVVFNPAVITIAPDASAAALLQHLVSGTTYDRVNIVGYDLSGTTPAKRSTDQLKLVSVGDLQLNADGSSTVQLAYGARVIRTIGNAPGNTFSIPVLRGWNRINNTNAADNSFSSTGAPDDSLPNTTPACYCPGTLIATPGGERAVETLVAGDLVLTADGRALPVQWIGRRAYGGRFVAANRGVLPVTIRAGALADGIPRRDLVVSPRHAMLLDGLLIPADLLVNGSSITQAARVAEVRYLHVELSQHEAILAEGAASESFIDDNTRGMFHNAAEYTGPRSAQPVLYFAPRIESGPILECIRQRLSARARSWALAS